MPQGGQEVRGDAALVEVSRPRSEKEAVAAAAKEGALPFAGGTDIMVLWNIGHYAGRSIVDLSGVSEWAKIAKMKEGVSLGSLVTHTMIRRSKDIQSRFPLLVQACATIGALQIQNRGTIGGNLANASPAGDTFPPLAVYEPTIVAVSSRGRRVIPFGKFFAGVKKSTLAPGELIAAVELHDVRKPSRTYFRKVGTRAAQAISKTVASGLLWLAKDGTVEELRFALGSVAPTVRRLAAAEAYLKGKKLTPDAISAACALVEKDISPIDDIRSTRDYRLAVSRNLLRDFLSKA
jgi:CO/xanthine dehydrogenase FAD-binding subunit